MEDVVVAEAAATTTGGCGGGVAAAPVNDDIGTPKDLTNIVKGKRTKRQRPQSPIPFTIATHSSSSNNAHDYNINNNNNNNNLITSPASSSDFPAASTTTEDEDTAECLLLLSRGRSLDFSLKNQINDDYTPYKFNSKRYIQTSTSAANGKAGIYVYECKTCSRTFPSFQALGGHRASHKKPKNNDDRRRPPPYMAFSDDDEQPTQFSLRKNNNSSSSSSLSLQLNSRVSSYPNKKPSSSKLHECSICGTEFNSGQALGGHMRRHRVAGGVNSGVISTNTNFNTNTNTTLSLIPLSPVAAVVSDDQDDQKSRNDGLCLDLDLNLPAPPEAAAAVAANQDQHRDSSFTFSTAATNQKKQQSAVDLSAAPTLVDCHY